MSSDPRQKAEEFKSLMEEKIQSLVREFAEGKISREQFHALYERYSARLSIATHALMTGNPDAVSIAEGGPPTIAVRDEYMGKVQGLLIYHNKGEKVLETLGDFPIPFTILEPTLEDFTLQMLANQLIDRRIEKIGKKDWLLFLPGQYTTVVILFINEPSPLQIRELERLRHDFEQANRAQLAREHIDTNALAYPFLIFVKKKFGK
ncbi:MAG: hypothetical protein SFZ02_08200 [bacterium]|nr:hypothetical protein [bacterium]